MEVGALVRWDQNETIRKIPTKITLNTPTAKRNVVISVNFYS